MHARGRGRSTTSQRPLLGKPPSPSTYPPPRIRTPSWLGLLGLLTRLWSHFSFFPVVQHPPVLKADCVAKSIRYCLHLEIPNPALSFPLFGWINRTCQGRKRTSQSKKPVAFFPLIAYVVYLVFFSEGRKGKKQEIWRLRGLRCLSEGKGREKTHFPLLPQYF